MLYLFLAYNFAPTWKYRNQSWTSKGKAKNLSCCHWNVNILLAHNLSKLSQLEAYNSVYKHDFIYISETFFDPSIQEGDKNIQLDDCNLLRADHPSNSKRGGVYIFYKETLGVCIVKSLSFNECIICEVSIQNSKGYVGVVYRSPRQNIFEFENFLSKFEKVLSDTTFCNSLFTIILGDFNARSSVWWTRDKTTIEGTQLESLTSVYGFHQLISQPTHLLPQTSSCIDLIFTDQPNLIVDSGVHPSLHSNCHHQITYCKINLNIEYPPPYEGLVWDYNRANVDGIKNSIESVNWEVMFNNKSVHKQKSIFNEILMNIFSNFTPDKLVSFDDRDVPWMNDFVKSKIKSTL